jgi:uncharacterized protein (TIGR03382 family)
MQKIGIVLAFAAATSSRLVQADVTRCSGADADLQYQNTPLAPMMGDTGWVPSGSDAQVRLTGRVAGQTTVAMGLHPTACWDSGMQLAAPGRAGTGLLDFAYGGELHLFAQIHTSVLGQHFDWSGEIPVPILPTDLMLANTQMFDPALLPGSDVDHVSGSDTTSPITVLSTNLIGQFIDIPGISGGLHVDVVGQMTTTYGTTMVSAGGDIASAGAQAALAVPADGFAAALDVPVSADGIVDYAPSLIFNLGFNVKIIGITVANWTLASVTMPLPHIDDSITLAGAGAHISLPKAASLAGAQIDFSTASAQTLAIHSIGEAPLMIEATTLPPGITVTPVTVAGGADGALAFTAADSFTDTADVVLATNDPGQPAITIRVGKDIGGTMTGGDDQGVQHGGCNAVGSAGIAGILLALIGLRRRRR